MDGMSIRQAAADDGEPVTTLEGELTDQAALAGVINTLYELHLPIISVGHVASSQAAEFDSRQSDEG